MQQSELAEPTGEYKALCVVFRGPEAEEPVANPVEAASETVQAAVQDEVSNGEEAAKAEGDLSHSCFSFRYSCSSVDSG